MKRRVFKSRQRSRQLGNNRYLQGCKCLSYLQQSSMADSSSAMATETSDCPEKSEDLTLPKRIYLFSGKRKSGKDYITDILHERLGSTESAIIKISGPIKSHWAKTMNLDLDALLSDGDYKEKYRMEMAKWGEEMRRKDYGYFCRAAVDMYNVKNKKIWIVSDIRRKTDIKWFTENYGDICKTIYIQSSIETRKKRGWVFTPGIDDSETECNLDDVKEWDMTIVNDNEQDLETILQPLLQLV